MRTRNGLYTLLQVLPNADPAVIEAAYKALMKKYHPDLHAGGDVGRKAAEINHAFTVLRDPERRAAYDAAERAREERYRVELARAFPEAPAAASGWADPARRGSAPPPRFEPSPRPSQRVAAWVGAAGAVVLAATMILFARDGADMPAATNAAMQPAGAEMGGAVADPFAPSPSPFRDEAVSRPRVAQAVAEFRRIAAAQGMQGAAAYSERCFEAQSETLSLGDFDHCVAFDYAAGRAALVPADSVRAASARRFQPQNQVERHFRAADPMADTYASIEIRLDEIRRLADSASAQAAETEPAGIRSPAPVTRPSRYSARRDPPQRRAAARQRPERQDQDFLEREGGIY